MNSQRQEKKTKSYGKLQKINTTAHADTQHYRSPNGLHYRKLKIIQIIESFTHSKKRVVPQLREATSNNVHTHTTLILIETRGLRCPRRFTSCSPADQCRHHNLLWRGWQSDRTSQSRPIFWNSKPSQPRRYRCSWWCSIGKTVSSCKTRNFPTSSCYICCKEPSRRTHKCLEFQTISSFLRRLWISWEAPVNAEIIWNLFADFFLNYMSKFQNNFWETWKIRPGPNPFENKII